MRPGQRRRRSDKDNIPAGIRKLPSPPTTLEQAQMEWDLVETVQPGKHSTYTCSLPELYLFSSFLLSKYVGMLAVFLCACIDCTEDSY